MCLQIYLEKEKQVNFQDLFDKYNELELLNMNDSLDLKRNKRTG